MSTSASSSASSSAPSSASQSNRNRVALKLPPEMIQELLNKAVRADAVANAKANAKANATKNNSKNKNNNNNTNNNTSKNNLAKNYTDAPGSLPTIVTPGAKITNGKLRKGKRFGTGPALYVKGKNHDLANVIERNMKYRPRVVGKIEAPAACTDRVPIQSKEFAQCMGRHLTSITKWTSCDRAAPFLARHQLRVYETAKVIAREARRDPHNHVDRGQLVWANTGSGKTVMALSVLLAYWDSPRRLYVVTTPEIRSANSPEKYLQNMKRYFPAAYDAISKSVGGNMKLAMDEHRTNENARVLFLSFEKLANMLGVGGRDPAAVYKNLGTLENPTAPYQDGSVLVCDEAHGMNELLKTRGKAKENLLIECAQKLRAFSPDQRRRVHVWGLTATPGKTIDHWLKLLSVVRRAETKDFSRNHPITPDTTDFVAMKTFADKYISGLVMPLEIRADRRSHACVKEVRYDVPMDLWYYAAYLNAVGGGVANFQPSALCRIGLVLYNNEFKNIIPAKVKAILVKRKRLLGTHWVSNKFILLARYLANEPGKHFVYVHDPGTAAALKMALSLWYGMVDVSAKALSQGGEWEVVPFNRRRQAFMMLVDNNLAAGSMTQAFNIDENVLGKQIKIVIASRRWYEGIDMAALRHIHLADPFESALQEIQAVGRGVRFCSHAGLTNATQRTVTVVRWYSVSPRKKPQQMRTLIDEAMRDETPARAKQMLAATRFIMVGQREQESHAGGTDVHLREKAIRDKRAVLLYNFERVVARVARTWSPVVRVLAGKKC